MDLIEWNSTLSVDIKAIDEQHKRLLNYLNNLYNALTKRKENEIIVQLFNDLENYAQTHFCLEEKCFMKFKYKDSKTHIPQHCEFRRKIAEMKKLILSNKEDAEDLLEFLVSWLINHIKKSDRAYKKCFREHGMH